MAVLYDYAVIGGGIIGLASAHALMRERPDARLVVLEKEPDWALHQTGHNSGVIHSGIYYKPGSLKARMCRAGNRSMVEFCQVHHIEHEICGKVIVATHPLELPCLDALQQRGLENGLRVTRIDPVQLQEIEPQAWGLAALQVAEAGIVDYRAVCQVLVQLLRQAGCDLQLRHDVTDLHEVSAGIEVIAAGNAFKARQVINCAGLFSDRVADLGRDSSLARKRELQIIPFRGEYFELTPQRRHLVRHLIYPVPNPDFPFLGVHFTRSIGGPVEAGPNAVLALAREGYRKSDLNLGDLREILAFPGFRKLARRYWREGGQELWRSLSQHAFVRSLQRLIPAIQAADLMPAATSSLEIGRHIAALLIRRG